MRVINVDVVSEVIRDHLIDININQGNDVKELIDSMRETESQEVARNVLDILKENAQIAKKEHLPICQDTGMAVIFAEVGQDIHFEGGNFIDAINLGVRRAYDEGFLRKSVVRDPLRRSNSGDNTPAIVHVELVEGEKLSLFIGAKGFGSENMSRSFMLKPSDGRSGVVNAVVNTVKEAGPNPCPPIIIGVGVGGTLDKAALLAKKALFRDARKMNDDEFYAELEAELLMRINELGIGPQGFGGDTTALGVNVEYFPTHIAGLPVVVNINCHASRHAHVVI